MIHLRRTTHGTSSGSSSQNGSGSRSCCCQHGNRSSTQRLLTFHTHFRAHLHLTRGGSHPIHGTSSVQRQVPPPDVEQDAAALKLRDSLGIQHWQYQAYIKPFIPSSTTEDPSPDVEAALGVLLSLSSRDRVQALLLAHPQLLGSSDLPAWAQFFSSYGVRPETFFSLLASHTRLFTRSSGLYQAGVAILFLMRLGLSHRDLAACVIPRHAELLEADPQGAMQPVVDLLEQELGIREPEQRLEMVAKCPQLLTLSVTLHLRPRLDFLKGLGLSRMQVRTLTQDVTSLLLSDPEPQLRPALAFLTSTCKLDSSQAMRVVLACPRIVTLSNNNLTRKWEFLVSQIQGGAAELMAYPAYLACSLLNETGPRFYFAKERSALALFHSRSCSSGSGAACPPRLSLEQLLGCQLSDYLAVVGAEEDCFCEFRHTWQISDGTRWSGMVSVVPGLRASTRASAAEQPAASF